MALLRDVVQKGKTSLTESRRWLLSSGDKEHQGLRRPDKVTRRPLRWQLLSRALTVAVYTFGLECGMVLALPTWMRVVSAYCAAAAVPMLLPTAHGANCRVATTIAATCLAGARVSLTSASVVSAVLFLCPAWILWWTKDRVDDSVTPILKKVLKWMDDHNNVLPTGYATPPPEKRRRVSSEKLSTIVAREPPISRRVSSGCCKRSTIEKWTRTIQKSSHTLRGSCATTTAACPPDPEMMRRRMR